VLAGCGHYLPEECPESLTRAIIEFWKSNPSTKPEKGTVSIRKGAFLRLSDFVNEYDFAEFQDGPNDGFRGVHYMLHTDEGYPDLAKRASP
jgi:hypothetical protein